MRTIPMIQLFDRILLPEMGVVWVAVDPGSGHEVGAAAVQHHCVTAFNGHLHSWIAGTINTTSLSYLDVQTL